METMDKQKKTNDSIWTFAPKFDAGNNYNITFASDGTPKLQASVKFTEDSGHDIKTINIEEITDNQGILTKDNVGYADGAFSINKDNLRNLADKLTSTENIAVTNKVSIVFKLTSTNDTSSNNIKYITNTFNFIKALKINNDNIKAVLNASGVDVGWVKDYDTKDMVEFHTSGGEYSSGIYTLKSGDKKIQVILL